SGAAGRDRQQGDRAGEHPRDAQERARQMLRRRHHAKAQAAGEAEGGQASDEARGERGDPAGGVFGGGEGRRRRGGGVVNVDGDLRSVLRLVLLIPAEEGASGMAGLSASTCEGALSSYGVPAAVAEV